MTPCHKKNPFKTKIMVAMLVFFKVIANYAFALSSDEKLPTYLSSNSAICEQQNGEDICTYLGNAKLNQGTTSLQAQQITIHKITDGRINKIVASGEYSHYSTILDSNHQSVSAGANKITIYPDENIMLLEGNGEVVMRKDKYSGPRIEYKLK